MSATPDSTLADSEQLIANLHRQLAECRAERDEALLRETATTEVLQVINSSPGDLAPVFDAMLERANRLCEADFGLLWTCDGDRYHPAAMRAVPTAWAEYLAQNPTPFGAGSGPARVLAGQRFVHVPDFAADEVTLSGDPSRRALVELAGARTGLAVRLVKDATLLGVFLLYRREVRPFSDKQIALLENFAAQAVIAMENARLLTETREALEQRTATAEVLQVINSSPGDLASVFDAMLERALQLCGAAFGILHTFDGERVEVAAHRGVSPAFAEFLSSQPPGLVATKGLFAELLRGESFVHIDAAAGDAYLAGVPIARALVEIEGGRSLLAVPLRRDGALLGAFVIYRREVRPFSDKQIALVKNFAAQAVIAMENARLMTETREALDQQTATAEVLQVINASPGDLAPVFDAMLEKAMRLCEAAHGHLYTYDGEYIQHMAVRGDARYVEWMRQRDRFRPAPGSPGERLVRGERLIHYADALEDDAYRTTVGFREVVDVGGIRSGVTVALRREKDLLGGIGIYRQEVRPFTEKQIALLQNFAAQAVIAMENARLLTETREALEQQTATAEVLEVINSSPGDLKPVFDAMLDKAMRLCGASFGTFLTFDGEFLHFVAARGHSRYGEWVRQQGPIGVYPGTTNERLLRGEAVVQLTDLPSSEAYRLGQPGRRAQVDIGGFRTLLSVALRKDATLLGTLHLHRQEARAFTKKQIALLQNFAAQAVIAMENARLLTETREALEQQTATAEVLQVINSSPGDLAPVFDAILEKAHTLCGAAHGLLLVRDGEEFRLVAVHGESRFAEGWWQLGAVSAVRPVEGGVVARLMRGEGFVHIADCMTDDSYRQAPAIRSLIETGRVRTALTVPLRKDGGLLGLIVAFRLEVRPFTDKQIALLQNFAAQAVIATENARLLTETREALEQQTATSEVLQVINSSPGNLTPVFDAMLDKAMRLCGAAFGFMTVIDGERSRTVAARGVPAAYAAFRERNPTPANAPISSRVRKGEPFIHTVDLKAERFYGEGDPQRRAIVDLGGARTLLAVPLMRDQAVLGAIQVYRTEVRPFTDKQIALLQNFAAQAVIAMENARLLDEIRQRQAELRITFDNMVDGVAMFDAELRLAAWNRNFEELLDLPDEFLAERHDFDTYIRYLTERGEFGETDSETEINRLRGRLHEHYQFERTRPDGTVIEVRHNPMPDGGVVLIYSDITERKRSEAEIHAARDAAEAAYRDLKAAQASLIQAEKMASLGQLTAGIAHEIKNPLNFVNNFAGLSVELLDELKETAAPAINALGEEKRAEIDETITMLTGNLEKIAEHGRRADGIVKSMLEHSRGTSGERRSVDLNGLIDEALNLAYHGGRAQDASFNITLEKDFAEAIAPIELVPQDITRVCLNLIGNGFYAATKRQKQGGDSKYKPTLKVSTRDLGDAVEINIRDNGVGITPEIKDKLFQPFFTTKPTGEGTGLGLSISYDIVTQEHGGTITVDSEIGEFTEFTIRLPRVYGATIAEAAS
jgi:PAS domain S-box-containing protein